MPTINKIQERILKTIDERSKAAQALTARAEEAGARITESKAELDGLLENGADEGKISAALNKIAAQEAIKKVCEEKLAKNKILSQAEVMEYGKELYNALTDVDNKTIKQLQPLFADIKAAVENRAKEAKAYIETLQLLEAYREEGGVALVTTFLRQPAPALNAFIQLVNRDIQFNPEVLK